MRRQLDKNHDLRKSRNKVVGKKILVSLGGWPLGPLDPPLWEN